MSFRKRDYIIFYIITVVILIMNLIHPDAVTIFGIVIIAVIPSVILGTITNFLKFAFKKK